jgi:uncharacterized membrane protein YtjA (UPF0391 family)
MRFLPSLPWSGGCSIRVATLPTAELREKGLDPMLHWALVFFVIALVAALFGFGGIATEAAGIGKILFFLFLLLAGISLLLGRRTVL